MTKANKMTKNYKTKFVVVTSLIFIAGCATNKGMINTSISPSYQKGSIEVLAVPRMINNAAAPSVTSQVTRDLTQAIKKKNPSIKIVSARKFNNILNNNNLVKNYSNFIEDYNTTGIADSDFSKKVAKHGIDGILISNLSRASQVDGQYGRNRGRTRVTISLALVNTHSDNIVWSASADGIKGTVTTFGSAPPINGAVKLAVDKVKQNIPNL